VIGYALGNAMNMGVTLAVYASICKETGRPFVFPGSRPQYEAISDTTDASLLARHMTWASTHDVGRNQAFNIVHGDLFRWRRMWALLAPNRLEDLTSWWRTDGDLGRGWSASTA
jgi:hypothetical protein